MHDRYRDISDASTDEGSDKRWADRYILRLIGW